MYAYDIIGNLTSKSGNGTYSYAAQSAGCGAGALDKAHVVVSISSTTFCYDANGNMVSGGGRTYAWTAENLVASVVTTRGTTTTLFFQGVFEQTIGGGWKQYYRLNGAVVAVRDSTGGVTYLHADHLGSVGLATNSSGAVVSQQEFDPWGTVRSGGISQTSLNYTGQRLDASGLLYYHARYYDPTLARFVSADSVVPGSASGGMDGIALKGLTVDFHEVGFVSSLNQENNQPFHFQMSQQQRRQAGSPWGPQNPQALNRYSYTLNNPLTYSDPSGHCLWDLCVVEAAAVVAVIVEVVIPAVVGAAVIATAATVGQELGRAQASMRQPVPGRPFTGPNAPERAYGHLEKYHGIDRNTARNRLHKIKENAGLAPNDDVIISRTGDVYDAESGEKIGSLTDPSLGKER